MASRTFIPLLSNLFIKVPVPRQNYLSVLLDAENQEKKEKEYLREANAALPEVVVNGPASTGVSANGVGGEEVNGVHVKGEGESEEMKEEEVGTATATEVVAAGEGDVATTTNGDVEMA